MNPLVQAQLLRLQQNVRALHRRHEETLAQLDDAREAADNHLRLLFKHERERSTLQVNQAQYLLLESRVKELESTQTALRAHAEKMGNLAAALAESLDA